MRSTCTISFAWFLSHVWLVWRMIKETVFVMKKNIFFRLEWVQSIWINFEHVVNHSWVYRQVFCDNTTFRQSMLANNLIYFLEIYRAVELTGENARVIKAIGMEISFATKTCRDLKNNFLRKFTEWIINAINCRSLSFVLSSKSISGLSSLRRWWRRAEGIGLMWIRARWWRNRKTTTILYHFLSYFCLHLAHEKSLWNWDIWYPLGSCLIESILIDKYFDKKLIKMNLTLYG